MTNLFAGKAEAGNPERARNDGGYEISSTYPGDVGDGLLIKINTTESTSATVARLRLVLRVVGLRL